MVTTSGSADIRVPVRPVAKDALSIKFYSSAAEDRQLLRTFYIRNLFIVALLQSVASRNSSLDFDEFLRIQAFYAEIHSVFWVFAKALTVCRNRARHARGIGIYLISPLIRFAVVSSGRSESATQFLTSCMK